MKVYKNIYYIALGTLIAGEALAIPLYSNGSAVPTIPALNPMPTSLSGVPAPVGTMFSECSSIGTSQCNTIAGLAGQSMDATRAFRFADSFTVPPPGWFIGSMSFFAYQPNALGPGSPFAAVNVRLWSGAPGTSGAGIIFGDTNTNRLTGTSSTNVYRIFNTITPPFAPGTDTTRLIWKLDTSINTFLTPGTYWVDFQIEPSDPALTAFVPTVTLPGVRTGTGFNALQYRYSSTNRNGAWEPIIDNGKPASSPDQPQDLPFLISGQTNCRSDFNHDMSLDFFDYLDFVDAFAAGSVTADINADGTIDFFDYLDFVDSMSAGC